MVQKSGRWMWLGAEQVTYNGVWEAAPQKICTHWTLNYQDVTKLSVHPLFSQIRGDGPLPPVICEWCLANTMFFINK